MTDALQPRPDAPQPRPEAASAPALVALVWAQARGGVIGAGGTMPWHLPEDMAHFKELTIGHTVVMGHATWRSLPERFRPLPERRNLVLSRRADLTLPGAEVVGSIPQALAAAAGEQVWVIGGGQVYATAIELATRLEVTEIDLAADGDTRAPVIGPSWLPSDRTAWLTSRTGLRYRFVRYLREAARRGA